MSWTIAEARRHFSDLVKAAREEPQAIYNRDRLVAHVIDPATFAEFESWRRLHGDRTVADAFAALRELCEAEDYTLEVPERRDRPNPFAADDELPR